MSERELTYNQAVGEAVAQVMEQDPRVFVVGLGVPDVGGYWGSTTGLQERFGSERAMDMPTSENGMTGVCVGAALVGRRPILMHQRVEFSLLAVEQMVNQAAKWHYMFGGRQTVPIVFRLIIGRGWGQGPQHCQSLQSWFAHIPGLRVVMPSNAYDAKGMYVSAIEDESPVVILEHRWLHNTYSVVPEKLYRVPLTGQRVVREGRDVTIAASSQMVADALRAAESMAPSGVDAEVVDVRSLNPFDPQVIVDSVRKTGRLLVCDTAWTHVGFSAEVLARVTEEALSALKGPPRRLGLAPCPTPTSRPLLEQCYPRPRHIVEQVREMLGLEESELPIPADLDPEHLDVPDASFRGPF